MKNRQLVFTLIALVTLTSSSLAQDLVEWRGIDRSGIYDETGLLKEWPATGPEMLWSFDGLGKGFSSVIVVGEKIFVTGQTDGIGYVYAIDKKGKLIWKAEYGKEWVDPYPGSRTTPVFYKGKLFLTSALHQALCMDAETGKIVWSVDMKAKFGAKDLKWGFVESPAICDNKVFFTPGGDIASVVALNVKTGETIWESKATGDEAAYCSPLVFEHKNKKYLATSLTKNVVGLDVNDGKMLWNISQVNSTSIHPNSPIYKDGCVYSVTGYKTGGVMIKLSDDGKTATELWRNSTLDSQFGGVVWLGNQIIGSGHSGDRSWQSLDAKTGKVLFTNVEMGKGDVIYSDGLFYCYCDNGEMGIMELNDAGFKLKSKFRILLGTEQHWAHPVIDKGVLYIRHGNTLMAYSIKK